MDFTLRKYSELLKALKGAGYEFVPYCEAQTMTMAMTMTETMTMTMAMAETMTMTMAKTMTMAETMAKTVCLRHDVDKRPRNSLKTARIEAKMGIRATYYFRAVPESWDEKIIKEIASLGHEIGYHYESLTTCNGDVDAAYRDFCENLTNLRKLIGQGHSQGQSSSSVTTICMHGSPRSPYDSKDIWKYYDYKPLGVIAEPYLDTDWSRTFYLTDTGRRWDGYNVSVRDKIPHWQDVWTAQGLVFHSTDDIIGRVNELPDRIMITTHPQRWSDNIISWGKELAMRNITKKI